MTNSQKQAIATSVTSLGNAVATALAGDPSAKSYAPVGPAVAVVLVALLAIAPTNG